MINLIDNVSYQPSKSRTKNWFEINDESRGTYNTNDEFNDELRGTYNTNSQIKFKTTMLKSSLCDYSDAYILVKGTIIVPNTATLMLMQIMLIKK